MIKKYLFALFINFILFGILFFLFIGIDININSAINRVMTSNSTNAAAPVLPPQVSACSNFINWDSSFYNDLNNANDETNYEIITISSNISAYAAFYSIKKSYYRFEVERFRLRGNIDPFKCSIEIYRNGTNVGSYMGPKRLYFTKISGCYAANWVEGWKPETGIYKAVLFYDNNPVKTTSFEIIARKPLEFKKTLSIVSLEYNQSIMKRPVYSSRGQKTDFLSGLIDWMDYGKIDAFFALTGETTGWGNISADKPWEYYPLKNLQTIGTALHAAKKMVGAYIMCFYTPHGGWEKAGYKPAMGLDPYNGIGPSSRNFVSFNDEKRFRDIVNFARYLNSLDYVDFIGFDFVRFGELAGYENADEFIADMNVETPSGWKNYTGDDRMLWLGRKLQGEENSPVKEKWNLWIAHKTADFIYRVRNCAGITKPIWVFTLGWDHGREHGQDPYFFQDAGVFSDFVMLYEASPDMFEAMKKSWTAYLGDETLNYIPGNQIDSVLLKSMYGYNPVEEYSYRLKSAVSYAPYFSRGVFIHDMSRAFWGRLGDYSSLEWLISGLSSVSFVRWLNSEIPYKIEIITNEAEPSYGYDQGIPVRIEFNPAFFPFLKGKTITIENIGDNIYQKIDIPEKTNIIISVKINPKIGKVRWFGLCSRIDGYPPYFAFDYIRKIYRNIALRKIPKGSGKY